MSTNIPIYDIAKELNFDSKRIISACKTLGIDAKGSTKRLNKEEIEKIKNYFETGRNVSEEVVEINKRQSGVKKETNKSKKETKIKYFANRLISKS